MKKRVELYAGKKSTLLKLNSRKSGVEVQAIILPHPFTGRNFENINSVELNTLIGKNMNRGAIAGFLCLGITTLAPCQTQQDYFVAAVADATRVSIVRIGPERGVGGAIRIHRLLDSSAKKQIARVADAIEMLDPKPTGRDGGDEVWAMSRLTFGVAQVSITFYRDDDAFLKYDLDDSMTFVAVAGAHAPHPIDGLLDHPLTKRSTRKLKRLVGGLKEGPNQPPEPMAGLAPGHGSS